MPSIECPKPAYERILRTGLDKRILQEKKEISKIFLYKDFNESKAARRLVQKAEKALYGKERISDDTEAAADIVILCRRLEEASEEYEPFG